MEALLFDVSDFPARGQEAFHTELLEWMEARGVDVKVACPFGAFVREVDGWHLHLAYQIRDEDGHGHLDPRRDLIATKPVDISIGAEPCWPTWLGQVVEVMDMPGAHIVEVMHHSHALRLNLKTRLGQLLGVAW